MKIRKNSEQRNFILRKDFYTDRELTEMLANHEIGYIDNNIQISYEKPEWYEFHEICFRVFVSELEKIEVKYIDDSYYAVATGKNGKEYIVEL